MFKLFKADTRWYVAAFIIILLVAAKFYQPKDIGHIFSICVLTCILDFIILGLVNRKSSFPLSALVTGLIISGILAPSPFFFIAALPAFLFFPIIKTFSQKFFFSFKRFGKWLNNFRDIGSRPLFLYSGISGYSF